MRIFRCHLEKLFRHAVDAYPAECCGFLVGSRDEGGAVHGVIRARNVAPRPEDRFDVDAEEFARADAGAEQMGWEVIGFYHSHPGGDARPSAVDVRGMWSGVTYLILAVSPGGVADLAAWKHDPSAAFQVQPVDLIVDEQDDWHSQKRGLTGQTACGTIVAFSRRRESGMRTDRYSRQIMFSGIGAQGQRRLGAARVVLVGCGADGSVMADRLVRAGVGSLTIIDRDKVEMSNLQRQVLYDEDDVASGRPKALAAADKLRRINSEVRIVPLVQDLRGDNAEALLSGADLVLDGTDNLDTRFVINDVCVESQVPWVYCAVAASYGTTMTIVPGRTPCFRCLFSDEQLVGDGVTCNTVGIANPVVTVMAGIAAAEAIKLLVGAGERNPGMLQVDLWHNSFEVIDVGAPRPDCPCCCAGGRGVRSPSGREKRSAE